MKSNLLKTSILAILFAPYVAGAATVYVEADKKEVMVGDEFEVSVMLDPEGEEINALEGDVDVGGGLIVKRVSDSDSFVTYWIERPELKDLRFSGLVPGGFRGELSAMWSGYRPGQVYRLSIRAEEEGVFEIRPRDLRVLLNDGGGTKARVASKPASVRVVPYDEGKAPLVLPNDDTTPPEPFDVMLVEDKSLNGGMKTLLFNTQDKQTGIYYYQVTEGGAEPVRAESPYALKDQGISGRIVVEAFDWAGNVQVAELDAGGDSTGSGREAAPWRTYAALIALVALTLILIARKWLRKH